MFSQTIFQFYTIVVSILPFILRTKTLLRMTYSDGVFYLGHFVCNYGFFEGIIQNFSVSGPWNHPVVGL